MRLVQIPRLVAFRSRVAIDAVHHVVALDDEDLFLQPGAYVQASNLDIDDIVNYHCVGGVGYVILSCTGSHVVRIAEFNAVRAVGGEVCCVVERCLARLGG